MRPAAAWKALGIAATADARAVRKAYAAKLKAIDPEADAAGFIHLREALETALAEAAWQGQRAAAPADAEGQGGFGLADQAPCDDPEAGWDRDAPLQPVQWDEWQAVAAPAGDAGGADPEAEAERAARDARFHRIELLLFADPDTWPDPDELAALTREILDDPAMMNIEEADAVGDWLAWAIADSIPRSDPMLAPVVGHFGWKQTAGHYDQPWHVEAVVERYRGLAYLDHLRRPDHPFHDAYRELTSEELKLGFNRFFLKPKVRKLLDTVRERCPVAEEGFDRHRVALWDDYLAPSVEQRLGRFAALFWLLFILVRLFVEFS